jgi:hypothetical protein
MQMQFGLGKGKNEAGRLRRHATILKDRVTVGSAHRVI